MNPNTTYQEFTDRMKKIADVKYALAVLQWDQETYLPPKGAAFRARQMATLSEIAHGYFTDAELGKLLEQLAEDTSLTETEKVNVRLVNEDYTKNRKYSAAFVRSISEATSAAYYAWIEARKKNDFGIFCQPLEKLVALKQEETQLLGFAAHPYDALLNEFEKGATVQWLDGLFEQLKTPLKTLLQKIIQVAAPDDHFLHQSFNKDAQWKFGLDMLRSIGFDFDAGRQDLSEHPFTTNFSANDVRVTTRIDENDFTSMTWSCLHEGGHALYEQGLPANQYGLPTGEFCSLGIHESQSRLWENCIGRSKDFIVYALPVIQQYFPQLQHISSQGLFAAINKVQPSLIRTEADELTYHFHVMIRYEVEKKLIDGTLTVKDLPTYWNQLYKEHLGVTVPDDKNGCLQDIHWSHGSFGYFPTYTLGSLYAAQLFATIQSAHPHLATDIRAGNFTAIHQWLQQHIYRFGRQFTSDDLCNKATGQPLQMEHFLQYIQQKYSLIYA